MMLTGISEVFVARRAAAENLGSRLGANYKLHPVTNGFTFATAGGGSGAPPFASF